VRKIIIKPTESGKVGLFILGEDIMVGTRLLLIVASLAFSFAVLVGAARADNNCAYQFTSGVGNTLVNYCVTANGNIAQIEMPSSIQLIGPNSEGYGICNESPAQNYTDYGVSDTGNWNPSVLVSHSSSSVKLARTTSDGNWTLTQTITKNTRVPSITVVMALTNNQATDHVAYLVRFADAQPPNAFGSVYFLEGLNGAVAQAYKPPVPTPYGLVLENAATPPFGFWRGVVQNINTGPNACAFAYNDYTFFAADPNYNQFGSIAVAYVGVVKAGTTHTVTLTYRGL
jgi:hypothetical protein